MQKLVYQMNDAGYYVGTATADASPLVHLADKVVQWDGNPATVEWLIPGGCVEMEPPTLPEGKTAHWNGSAWDIVDPPADPHPPIPDVPTSETPKPPITLTRVQFFTIAALPGIVPQSPVITQDEAKAALKGDIPAAFQGFINTLPADQQFPAEMLISGTASFHRDHPFVAAFAASLNPPMTSEQVDTFFLEGSAIS